MHTEMSRRFIVVALLLCGHLMHAQTADFDNMLKGLLKFSVPVVTANELHNELKQGGKAVLIDARDAREFDVSRIDGSRNLPWSQWNEKQMAGIPRNAEIVVYCSVGYRSEKMGEKLRSMGYAHVRNLYGGIFSWMNEGFPVVNLSGVPTRRIHTYNRDWAKWLTAGEKISD